MKSSTITLAVTLAISSSSSVSGIPHYLDSVSDAPLSVRAPAYFIKRSLLDSQSADYASNALAKRAHEKKSSSKIGDAKDNGGDDDGDGDDGDDDCDESLDAEDEVKGPTDHYYKIGSNATGGHVPSSTHTKQNAHEISARPPPVPEDKSASYGQSETSKGSHQPSSYYPKAAKPSFNNGASSFETYTSHSSHHTSTHAHYGGSESGSSFAGKATFFSQDGNPGACGKTHQDTDFIVAIQSEMYDGGKYCGKTVVVTRTSTGQSIECIAADACPGCPSKESLDLSNAAFLALGKQEEGIFDITWEIKE